MFPLCTLTHAIKTKSVPPHLRAVNGVIIIENFNWSSHQKKRFLFCMWQSVNIFSGGQFTPDFLPLSASAS